MIRFKTLPNGVRVLTEQVDSVRSCSIGLWVEVGSRLERPGEFGLTHFIEHMLFKGTPRFDALTLADELNRLGGNVNAHTSQEVICLHARCVDQKAPAVLDLLSEMLLDSTFPREEIVRERNVILEEYKMYDDNPDDLVVDRFFQTLWPKSALGRPIIGTPSSIRKFSANQISKYWAREFDPRRLLIAVAGKFDEAHCRRVIADRFRNLGAGRKLNRIAHVKSAPAVRRRLIPRRIEQVHFCFGGEAPARLGKDRYAFGLLNMVLGGGMSSRLFREVREKRGLVYNIQSFAQGFADAGSFGIVGSTSPQALNEVLMICRDEMNSLREKTVSEDELEIAREQILDSLLMGIESTASRMMRLAETALAEGRPITHDELVDRINRVTAADLRRAAKKYFAQPMRGAFIGPKGIRVGAEILPSAGRRAA